MLRRAVLMTALCFAPGNSVAAQCPDGTPPPCAGARAPAPPDPNRIAILPFHVTTADTLLGEGLSELVATALTGEHGPQPAHVGTVLRAWRRAGVNLRTPLGQDAAQRVARRDRQGQGAAGDEGLEPRRGGE